MPTSNTIACPACRTVGHILIGIICTRTAVDDSSYFNRDRCTFVDRYDTTLVCHACELRQYGVNYAALTRPERRQRRLRNLILRCRPRRHWRHPLTYTVTIADESRLWGGKPSTFAVTAANKAEAAAEALTHAVVHPEPGFHPYTPAFGEPFYVITDIFPGLPDRHCGYFWNDHRRLSRWPHLVTGMGFLQPTVTVVAEFRIDQPPPAITAAETSAADIDEEPA